VWAARYFSGGPHRRIGMEVPELKRMKSHAGVVTTTVLSLSIRRSRRSESTALSTE